MSFCVRPSRRPLMRQRVREYCVSVAATAALSAAAALFVSASAVRADTPPAPQGDTAAALEQAKIDAAMNRMRARQQQLQTRGNVTPTTSPTTAPTTAPVTAPITAQSRTAQQAAAPATQPATQPAQIAQAPGPYDPYSREIVTTRKLEMVQNYDLRIAQARMALRRRQLDPADVRDLLNEQAALQHMSIERFRQLLIETDERNAQRVDRYRRFFGDLDGAAKTVVTILMKAGLIDNAVKLPDDPLTEDLELARGVRRVYFTFVMPSREGPPRKHNGYVEFLLAATEKELWLPTWADLEGAPIPLFDAQAFFPLRSYRIVYDGQAFTVAQDTEIRQTPLFSLLSPPPPPMMDLPIGRRARAAAEANRNWNGVFAAPRMP